MTHFNYLNALKVYPCYCKRQDPLLFVNFPYSLFAIPCTVAHQAPLSMGLSREEYWSGLLFPNPGYLPNPGFEHRFPAMQETWVQSLGLQGRSPEEGNDNPLQYSCLGNAMDREAWWATVHGIAKSWTQLSD